MESIQQKILVFVNSVINCIDTGNTTFIDLYTITDIEAKKLGEVAGEDFRGYIRTLDAAGIKHALKHTNLSASDLLLIPFIVSEYDNIGYGTKPNTIVYTKLIGDKYFYVEEIRVGRKKLVIKTLYKTKKRQP